MLCGRWHMSREKSGVEYIIFERNEINWDQTIFPEIIKNWLNGLCNLLSSLQPLPTLSSTYSLCKTRLGRERRMLWVGCCWRRTSTVALPSSHPERKEKLPFPKSPPPNGKRASNITLRDLEYLTDILFFSLSYIYTVYLLVCAWTYTCWGKRNGKRWQGRENASVQQSVFSLLGGA